MVKFSLFMALSLLVGSSQQQLIHDCLILPADVVFCMDASGSIDSYEFVTEKDFMKLLLEKLWEDKLGNDASSTYVGVTQFSSTSQEEFGVGPHGNIDQVDALIDAITQLGGGTTITSCLEQVCTTQDRGVPKLVITVTDGNSGNPEDEPAAVQACHDNGWTLAAIGVGGATEDRLDTLSSVPELGQIEANFNDLITEAGDIFNVMCNILGVKTPPTVPVTLVFNKLVCDSVSSSFVPHLHAEVQQAICDHYNVQYPGACTDASIIQIDVANIRCGSVHVDFTIPEGQSIGKASDIANTLNGALQSNTTSYPILSQNPAIECINPTTNERDHLQDSCQPQCDNSSCGNPFATCVESSCGGCHAVWYDATGVSDCIHIATSPTFNTLAPAEESCAGKCENSVTGNTCSCVSLCQVFGNCCSDYRAKCVAPM